MPTSSIGSPPPRRLDRGGGFRGRQPYRPRRRNRGDRGAACRWRGHRGRRAGGEGGRGRRRRPSSGRSVPRPASGAAVAGAPAVVVMSRPPASWRIAGRRGLPSSAGTATGTAASSTAGAAGIRTRGRSRRETNDPRHCRGRVCAGAVSSSVGAASNDAISAGAVPASAPASTTSASPGGGVACAIPTARWPSHAGHRGRAGNRRRSRDGRRHVHDPPGATGRRGSPAPTSPTVTFVDQQRQAGLSAANGQASRGRPEGLL